MQLQLQSLAHCVNNFCGMQLVSLQMDSIARGRYLRENPTWDGIWQMVSVPFKLPVRMLASRFESCGAVGQGGFGQIT